MLRWIVTILVGAVIGALSAWLMSSGRLIGGQAAIDAGGWRMNPMVGAPGADPWTRAIVARVGLLALRREETVYFDRTTDQSGRPLDGRCTYELRGEPLPARWWSITLYAEDQMLARNADAAASIDATRAPGAWRAVMGPQRPDGGLWLSTAGAARPIVMMRLYNPTVTDDAGLARLRLPVVIRTACPGGAA